MFKRMHNNDVHLRRLEVVKNQERVHDKTQKDCYQALIIVINSFLGYRMTYDTFQQVVIDTMDNFGDDTVDLLIEALQEYKKKEEEIKNEL